MFRLNCTRLMLSTPPAITMPASPVAIRLAAMDAAVMPEPQYRLMVTPGVPTPKPASSAALRANVVTGRALGQTTAKNDIFDFTGINPRTLDGVSQDVRTHGNTMCLVERAAAGLGDAGAAIGNNGDVLHTDLPGLQR
jgi:hypothetical protein